MDKERFMALPAEIVKCLKCCEVEDVKFINNFSDNLLQKPIHEYLETVISELTDNCVDKGAKRILITLSDNSVRVEDDVIESSPEETLEFLNEIKNSGKLITTRSKQREDKGCGPGGGMGLSLIIGYLNRVGGNLDYFIVDGRIVAEATWV